MNSLIRNSLLLAIVTVNTSLILEINRTFFFKNYADFTKLIESPVISGGGDFCRDTNPSVTLIATGCSHTVNWSNGDTGTSIVISNSGNYSAVCDDGTSTSAVSNTEAVTFYNPPFPPEILVEGPTTFCEGESVTLKQNSASNSYCNGTLTWNTGEVALEITVTQSGNYYATCSNAACTSDPSSVIQVMVNPVPAAPTVSGGGDFCTPTTSTTLTASGCSGTVNWNDGQSGNSITVSSSGSYTASCTESGCTSAASTAAVVNFYTTPSAPVIEALSSTSFCSGGNVTLQIAPSSPVCSGSINWSNGATGNSIVVNSTGSYSATCIEKGCVSSSSNTIGVTVSPQPAAPTVSGGGDFCTPTTSTTLTASGCSGTVNWNDGQSGNSITVSSSGSYTASCTESGCTSAASTAAVVNFYTTPSAPVIEALSSTSFCSGGNVTLQIAPSSPVCSGSINWSNGATGNSIVVNSTGSYSATCIENGCVSSSSNTIGVTVSPQPAAPTVSGGGDFCTPTTSTTLTASGCSGTVNWNDGQSGNTITVSTSGSYTASCTESSCTSAASTAAVVNFYTTPFAPVIEALSSTSFCSGGNVTLQIAPSSPVCGGTINWSNGATGNSIVVNSTGSYSATCIENGCVSSSSNTIGVTVSPQPAAPTVSGGGDFCTPTTSRTLTASGCSGTVNWNDGQSGNTITVSTSGSYTASCTESSCTSAASTAAVVNFYTTPSAPVIEALSSTSFFSGGNVTLQIAPSSPVCGGTINWSNGATGNSIVVNSTGSYSATCIEKGCVSSSSNTIGVTVSPQPAAPTVSGGGDFCTPTTSTTLTASGCSGTVNWNDGQSGNSITVSSSGSYTASCTESGCTSAASTAAVVNFYTTPSAPVIEALSSTSFCSGGNVTLQIAPSSPVCGGTINWSNGATGNSIVVNSTGSYSATCIENGCVSSSSNVIQTVISGEITYTESIKNISCYGGADGSIEIIPYGGNTGSYTIGWQGSVETGLTRTGLSLGTYSFTISDNAGCHTAGSVVVSQPDEPSSTIDIEPFTCHNAFDGKINLTATGGVGQYSYVLNGVSTSSFTNANSTDFLILEEGTFNLKIIDKSGCLIGEYDNLVFKNPPSLDLSLSTTNPKGFNTKDGVVTGKIEGGTTPYQSIIWMDDTGADISINSWLDVSGSPIASILTGRGGGNFTLTVKDNNGCIASQTAMLTAPPELKVMVEMKGENCFGEANVSLFANAEGGIPLVSNPHYRFDWYKLDDAGNATLILSEEDSISNLALGNYQIKVTDSNDFSITQTIEVQEYEEIVIRLVDKLDNYCSSSPKGFIETEVSGGLAPYNILWSNGSTELKIADISSGKYTLQVTDNLGCKADSTFAIENTGEPLSTLLLAVAPTCYEDCDGKFLTEVKGGITPYSIEWNNFSDSTGKFTLTNMCGFTEAQFTIKDSLGCESTSNFATIRPPEELYLRILGGTDVCPSDFDLYGETDWAVSYLWTLPNGGELTSGNINGSEIGTYTLTAKDRKGCTATISKTVEQIEGFEPYFAGPSITAVDKPTAFVNISEPYSERVSWVLPPEVEVITSTSSKLVIVFNKTGVYTLEADVNYPINRRGTYMDCAFPIEKEITVISQEEYDEGGSSTLGNIYAPYIKLLENPVTSANIQLEVHSGNADQYYLELVEPSLGTSLFKKKYSGSQIDVNISTAGLSKDRLYLLLIWNEKATDSKRLILR